MPAANNHCQEQKKDQGTSALLQGGCKILGDVVPQNGCQLLMRASLFGLAVYELASDEPHLPIGGELTLNPNRLGICLPRRVWGSSTEGPQEGYTGVSWLRLHM